MLKSQQITIIYYIFMTDQPKHKHQVAYDEQAQDFYDESNYLISWQGAGRRYIVDFFGRQENPQDTKITELGCASGRVIDLATQWFEESNITGIEISPEQAAIAAERFPEANIAVGNIADPALELPGEQDIVYTHMVFEHLTPAELAQTFDNAYQALKPGGALMFVVTHPEKILIAEGDGIDPTTGEFQTTAPWGDGNMITNYYITKEQYEQMLAKAGFETVEMSDVHVMGMTDDEWNNVPDNMREAQQETLAKYNNKYNGLIRLGVVAKKPLAA